MRLFIALELPAEIKNYLEQIISDLKKSDAGVKWVKPEQIHLTVKFLGETDSNKVSEIINSLNTVSAKHKKMHVSLSKLGVFPNLVRPKVIWVGLEGEIGNLAIFAEEIENDLEKIGSKRENRKFKAHLTLGRVKSERGIFELSDLISSYTLKKMQFDFEKLLLFKSVLTPEGPIYSVISQVKLN